MTQHPDRTRKHVNLIILGNSNVGKTQITQRYTKEEISPLTDTKSIGTYVRKKIVITDTFSMEMEIWVIKSTIGFISIFAPFYLKEADAAIIVIATKTHDLQMKDLLLYTNLIRTVRGDIPILLVNNLKKENPKDYLNYFPLHSIFVEHFTELPIDPQQLIAFMHTHDFMGYIECSVDDNIHIEQTFRVVLEALNRPNA